MFTTTRATQLARSMRGQTLFLAVSIGLAPLAGCSDPAGGGDPSGPTGASTGASSSSGATGVTCAAADHPGGDWSSLNQGLDNTRHQRAEHVIGVDEAPALKPAWTFLAADHGAIGAIQSTPIVANGCVYISASTGFFGPRGDVFALNADTGELVWHATIGGSAIGLAAANGLIYAIPSNVEGSFVSGQVQHYIPTPIGTHALALDAFTGEKVWLSERLDDGDGHNGSFSHASPVAFGRDEAGLVFVPLAGGSGDGARIPMYFLDARTGRTVKKAFSIPEAETDVGFGGTGIWSTAAFDVETGYLYAGTADSDGYTKQHPYNNAILKIDANPGSATFGSVLGHYSGTNEHYDLDKKVPGYTNPPTCRGPVDVFDPDFSASTECLEFDLDFGASPNLVKGSDGKTMLSVLQKSGVMHVVDTAAMEAVWTKTIAPGGGTNNAGTAAVDGENIYVGATPNTLFSFAQKTGAQSWVSTTGMDALAYQPLTLANGVLYTITDLGFLVTFDASTGLPLSNRLVSADVGLQSCAGAGAGVAVARNTVYVPCDGGFTGTYSEGDSVPGALVAYR